MQVGDKVMRKAHYKNPSWYWTGVVKRLYQLRHPSGEIAEGQFRAEVAWPAPHRINGNGWHHSMILARSLVVVTEEEIATRKALRQRERETARRMAEHDNSTIEEQYRTRA